MTHSEFDEYVELTLKQVFEHIRSKGAEYAHDPTDRFDNFNRSAKSLGITPLAVGLVFLEKHLSSIATQVRTGVTFAGEPIQSRVTDAIAYLLLIGGMAREAEIRLKAQEKFKSTQRKETKEVRELAEEMMKEPFKFYETQRSQGLQQSNPKSD